MRRVFKSSVTGREAAQLLADLRQVVLFVSDYSIEYCGDRVQVERGRAVGYAPEWAS